MSSLFFAPFFFSFPHHLVCLLSLSLILPSHLFRFFVAVHYGHLLIFCHFLSFQFLLCFTYPNLFAWPSSFFYLSFSLTCSIFLQVFIFILLFCSLLFRFLSCHEYCSNPFSDPCNAFICSKYIFHTSTIFFPTLNLFSFFFLFFWIQS